MERAALRGEPSYVWRAGQERRLRLIFEAAGEQARGRILDDGCGVGMYLQHLTEHAAHASGVEFDRKRAIESKNRRLDVVLADGELLPYASDSFDLVLSHEVLEHVEDDRAALEEIARVLRRPDLSTHKNGGRLILFVPNRGYPFETHGIYWRGHYRFGNIPLVNYLPRPLRNRLAPHVRTYSRRDLDRLVVGLPMRVVSRTVIFGAYDNIIARWPTLGRALRAVLHFLERTPLLALGLSHFWVLERI
ncbi:MAG: methyltransferase domain-containing protein [Anaerolineales bacterium]|nr:methyltransferase domain-containing protein [Anaerolineales bacterium]